MLGDLHFIGFRFLHRQTPTREHDHIRETPSVLESSKGSGLARAFLRLRWTGFWLQVVFSALPIILMVYYLSLSRSGGV